MNIHEFMNISLIQIHEYLNIHCNGQVQIFYVRFCRRPGEFSDENGGRPIERPYKQRYHPRCRLSFVGDRPSAECKHRA